MERPRLKGYLTLYPHDAGTLGLHGGADHFFRLKMDSERFRACSVLLGLLDGTRTLEQVVAGAAARGLDEGLVRHLLSGLVAARVIEDAAPAGLSPIQEETLADQILFFSRFTGELGGAVLQRRLAERTVQVIADGELGVRTVVHLARAGVGRIGVMGPYAARAVETWTREGEGQAGPLSEVSTCEVDPFRGDERGMPTGDLLIVAQQRWRPWFMERVNAWALQNEVPWLLIQCRSMREGMLGPLFLPGLTACFECLQGRLRSNRILSEDEDLLNQHLREREQAARPIGTMNAALDVLAAWAVVDALKHLAHFAAPRLAGRFVVVDWFDMRTEHHDVLRLPRCAACSPVRDMPEPFPWKEVPVRHGR